MKKNILNNSLAIAELGLLSVSRLTLTEMDKIANGDPIGYYQEKIKSWGSQFDELIALTCTEMVKYINISNRVKKVVWVGHEAILFDGIAGKVGKDKKQIIIPNHRDIDTHRMLMNFSHTENVSTAEIDDVWDSIFGETILFVPFFELSDGSCWSYRYPSMILHDRLNGKPRKIVGVCLLDELDIDADEDYYIGSLSLLTKINPLIFKTIISVEPKINTHELYKYTHSG